MNQEKRKTGFFALGVFLLISGFYLMGVNRTFEGIAVSGAGVFIIGAQ